MSKHIYKNILTKKLLEREYVESYKTFKQIAKKLNCSKTTIKRYLILHSIAIRTIAEVKKGIRRSEETKNKISKTRIRKGVARGENNPNYRGKFYGVQKKVNWSGCNNPKYIDGRHPLSQAIYGSSKY